MLTEIYELQRTYSNFGEEIPSDPHLLVIFKSLGFDTPLCLSMAVLADPFMLSLIRSLTFTPGPYPSVMSDPVLFCIFHALGEDTCALLRSRTGSKSLLEIKLEAYYEGK